MSKAAAEKWRRRIDEARAERKKCELVWLANLRRSHG